MSNKGGVMMKYIRYSIRFLLIIFVVIVTANISNNVYETKIENDNINKVVNLSTMALKVEEVNNNLKYSAKDTYTGDLTGYAHDCPLCGGTLGCLPSYNVRDRRTTYPDAAYGEVRIVASSKNLACGSIVRFNSPRISSEPVYAIVLDRGVLGNDLDLLVEDETYATTYVGRQKISYDVLRNGWE